ncbi:hypothetical protein HNQ51_000134 [Inhella inkyongensis]|uniref:Uncharacterized protein n=1 Tax=Inhella inkyongensis TaxID=392593 RepID=A0A840S2D1_9BURK|nr:hypothetical protein [Inhella inkyongensis]MBB5202841.1 hypothetical protein [Inhella inkyongensis]
MTEPNPIVTAIVWKLDEDLREAWEERAAVLEFDAGLSRELAECLALLDLIRMRPADVLQRLN